MKRRMMEEEEMVGRMELGLRGLSMSGKGRGLVIYPVDLNVLLWTIFSLFLHALLRCNVGLEIEAPQDRTHI